MPKAEKGTPKYLANKMKSKGLQKLRWYCQMCEKQCRDENGFKCHISSESHQRQLLLFADNPHKFLNNYSHEFERDFMHLLKRCHGTKRVKAHKVYNAYIADKEHVHMNATKWESLTGFIHSLANRGKVELDQTEEGWFITWIDRDPETIKRQEALQKREKMDKDDTERMADFISQQVEKNNAKEKEMEEEGIEKYTELIRYSEDEKIEFGLKLDKKPKADIALVQTKVFKAPKVPEADKKQFNKGEKRKKSALEEIMETEMSKKKTSAKVEEKKDPKVKDYWLKKDIVVKVVTKSLGDKYYKKKAVVKEVVDKYAAVVAFLDEELGSKKVKFDQTHLETVIPAAGKEVLILNGLYRGYEGTLVSIDVDSYSAYVRLEGGDKDEEPVKLPYEHFSKLY